MVWSNWLKSRCKANIVDAYASIMLCDARINPTDAQHFVEYTKKALQIIEKNDPRRYNTIIRHIKCIAFLEVGSYGLYYNGFCCVDCSTFHFEDNEEWYIYRYACTIVHEATHGRIEAFKIRYNKKTRARIERLCFQEAKRFLNRARPRAVKDVLGEFNETRWYQYWNIWTKFKAIKDLGR